MAGIERRGLCATAIVACFLLGLADGAAAESTREQVGAITARLRDGRPLVFATFGNSITWPCFHTNFRQNYITFTVEALRKAYPRARVRVVHGGNMGTAARGLA